MKYYHRKIEAQLKTAIEHFPATLITGARQVGKSTLLKKMLPDYTYVSLDDPIKRSMAKEDPALFLSSHPTPLVIDEIQYVPELLSYIKMEIDKKRDVYGRYVLTGSQAFALMQNVSESLAGRIMILNLLPFSWTECGFEEKPISDDSLREMIFRGFYPELLVHKQLDPNQWYSSYLSTYIERDVRNIQAVIDLQTFQKFITLLALRAGQLLNLTEVAKECGISSPTAKGWLSILESSYIVYVLTPYFKNKGKRLIKTPKVYFYDTGLLCYLLGIDHPTRLTSVIERGHLFENMMVMEAVKQCSFEASHTQLSFYRTANQLEIDLVVERKGETIPYEIKYSKSIKRAMASSLDSFLQDYGLEKGYLLSLYEDSLKLTPKVKALHWSTMPFLQPI